MTDTTTTTATTTALAKKIEGKDVDKWRDLIDRQQQQFGLALQGTDNRPLIAPEKFARVALTAIRNNPMLQQASVPSLMGAIMGCAQLGLEPHGPLGQAYLVPFKKGNTVEVQLIIGYQGLIDLVYRSGRVTSIMAETIHDHDEFRFERGTNAHILHRPPLADRGDLIGVYAIANLVGGGQVFEVMSKADVDRHKGYSKATGPQSPWASHYEAMAKKTVVRQLFKWLPSSVENQMALGADGGVFREIPESPDDFGNVIDIDEVV